MNIQDLGSVGELIGSIGMIVTLTYVAIQVRQNTLTTKMQMIQDAANAQQQMILRIMDDDMAERAVKDHRGEATTEIEDYKSRCWYIANLRGYESYFLQNQQGLFDKELHQAKSNLLMSWFANKDMKDAWEGAAGRGTYHPDFVNYVDQLRAT